MSQPSGVPAAMAKMLVFALSGEHLNLSRNLQLAIKHYASRDPGSSLCYRRNDVVSQEVTITKGMLFENNGSIVLTYVEQNDEILTCHVLFSASLPAFLG